MPEPAAEKKLAAERAVAEIRPGMAVGLGTGSTAEFAIRALGRRVAEGLTLRLVAATSRRTEQLASEVGLAITPFGEVAHLDLAIDGADEIDPQLRAIKGGGGALLREKVIATAADRVLIITDAAKPVPQLGRFPLPVEVLPFAQASVERRLARFGVPMKLRRGADGAPFVTDQQAHIFDLTFGAIEDPQELAETLQAIPGVLGHGLFLSEVDELFVGHAEGVRITRRA